MDGRYLCGGEGGLKGFLSCPLPGHSVFAFLTNEHEEDSWGYFELRRGAQGIEFRENAAIHDAWQPLRNRVACVSCRARGIVRHFDEEGLALELTVAD